MIVGEQRHPAEVGDDQVAGQRRSQPSGDFLHVALLERLSFDRDGADEQHGEACQRRPVPPGGDGGRPSVRVQQPVNGYLFTRQRRTARGAARKYRPMCAAGNEHAAHEVWSNPVWTVRSCAEAQVWEKARQDGTRAVATAGKVGWEGAGSFSTVRISPVTPVGS